MFREGEGLSYKERMNQASREAEDESHRERAEAHNSSRTLLEKVLGRDKKSTMDIAYEDALGEDERRARVQEVMKEIIAERGLPPEVETPEEGVNAAQIFTKDVEEHGRVTREGMSRMIKSALGKDLSVELEAGWRVDHPEEVEDLRNRLEEFKQAIAARNYLEAMQLMPGGYVDVYGSLFEEPSRRVLTEHIHELLKSHDYDDLIKFLDVFDWEEFYNFGETEFADDDVLKDPSSLDGIVDAVDRYREAGIADDLEANRRAREEYSFKIVELTPEEAARKRDEKITKIAKILKRVGFEMQ